MRILLVEDEARISHFVAKGLREQGFSVDIALDAVEATRRIAVQEYDFVILDVLLPGKDGLTLCRELRASGFGQPVLMLTGCDSEEDRTAGLNAGADDYLCKPFEFRELQARIGALLKTGHRVLPDTICISDLVLDRVHHSGFRRGRNILLTAREFALLELLVARKGSTVSRDEIARQLWRGNSDLQNDLIETYIRRIRKKIDCGGRKSIDLEAAGEGYMLSARDN
jgi:DNA-binding response OmpR family regulator